MHQSVETSPSMSKNTASNKFRKVNVDAFDEDNYEDEAVEVEGLAAQITAREVLWMHIFSGNGSVIGVMINCPAN